MSVRSAVRVCEVLGGRCEIGRFFGLSFLRLPFIDLPFIDLRCCFCLILLSLSHYSFGVCVLLLMFGRSLRVVLGLFCSFSFGADCYCFYFFLT